MFSFSSEFSSGSSEPVALQTEKLAFNDLAQATVALKSAYEMSKQGVDDSKSLEIAGSALRYVCDKYGEKSVESAEFWFQYGRILFGHAVKADSEVLGSR